MLNSIRRTLRELRSNTSGNATLLVAAGLPALIGASGLAVDSAQYYMWKRELQFAVDQAALAGAWAKTSTAMASSYSVRATQEYQANMQVAGGFDSAPTISVVSYNGGSGNAIKVVSTATKTLPFTNVVTGRTITVRAEAQAAFTAGVPGSSVISTIPAVSACLVALHPSAAGAFTLGGTASGSVTCGGATLSSDANGAIRENGNPPAQFGSLSATGGIEASLLNNVGGNEDNLKSNQAGLTDPFAGIATPTGNGVAKTYSCPTASAGATTTTATVTTVTSYVYKYYTGSNTSTTTPTTPTPTTAAAGYLANPVSITSGPTANVTVPNGTVAGTPTPTPTLGTYTYLSGSGSSRKYRVLQTTVTKTYASIATSVTGGSDGIARPTPGTYSNINIACTTQFAPGIYVITGSIDFSNNQTITGSDVMFVMSNANQISNINSNTAITLSGITAATLTSTYGYGATNAAKLAGMLFWDPNSTDQIKWNGNSVSILNGAMYMPNRPLWFNGTASVTGRCMMLIGSTLMFTGTIDMSSFCVPTGSSTPSVRPETTTTTTTVGTSPSVKLVV
jgi:Flp pilus assembly protein TadG